jgi:hypothetical protein
MLGRRAALGVPALGDLLDDFRGEGSPGWREVITPWSTTTGESSHLASALITSVLIER